MLKQFDIIQIITTKRIRYLSAPPGSASSPQGDWNVIGMIGPEVVAAKDSTLVRVPLQDVRKVGSYNLPEFLKELYDAGYKTSQSYSMAESISQLLEIDIAEARRFLVDHTLKTTVKTTSERDQIIRKALELWQKNQQKQKNQK